jgi:hypothetical protein
VPFPEMAECSKDDKDDHLSWQARRKKEQDRRPKEHKHWKTVSHKKQAITQLGH